MTFTSTVNRVNYAGNGSTTAFAFNYLTYAEDDIKVILIVDSTGVETVKTLTTHYTITGEGGAALTITMVTPPASGETLVIIREEQLTQGLDLVENDPFPSALVEQQFDILTMVAQQINTEVQRSLKLSDGDTTGADGTLPTPAANKSFIWDSNGTALVEGPTASEISGAVASATAAAASATAAAASESAADADATATAADLVETAADVVLTNADVVLTNADVVSTAADLVATNLDQISADADATSTAADVVSTNADVVTTTQDAIDTAADAVLTAADLVLTDADQVAAAASAAEAAASAASVPNMDAVAGIIDATTAVAMKYFGPARDGVDWLPRVGSALASSTMLAVVRDAGADTAVDIYSMTGTNLTTLTPLATVTITGAATPTSIDAAMGYIIVGHEDGISIIDCFDGSWAERTQGWPKSLSTATVPVLVNNNVQGVAAGYADTPTNDPRTGGPMPTFLVEYGAGASTHSILKDNGAVFDRTTAGTGNGGGIAFVNGRVAWNENDAQNGIQLTEPISLINADSGGAGVRILSATSTFPFGFIADGPLSVIGEQGISASSVGVTFMLINGASGTKGANAMVNTVFNTGYMVGDIRGAWLANSKTVDRSYKLNTLTETGGTVTEGPVEAGAELLGYSGFSSSNYLSRASDADWDVLGTGALCMSCWFKSSGNSTVETFMAFENSGSTIRYTLRFEASGIVRGFDDGATAAPNIDSVQTYDDGVWHKADWVRRSSTNRELYIDGVSVGSSTTDAGSLSDSGNLPLAIGANPTAGGEPATTSSLALARLSATAPTATQVRPAYIAERGMFVASAECLLQSSSTDAVIDVSVDPITGKVLVTQTDDLVIFNGLTVESEPVLNAGTGKFGQLYGDDRFEINSSNVYGTIAAKSLRNDLETLRGMAAQNLAGVDLSKAKAWGVVNQTSFALIASYNIKSVTDVSNGRVDWYFGVPFKAFNYITQAACSSDGNEWAAVDYAVGSRLFARTITRDVITGPASPVDTDYHAVVFFGELENE